MKNILAQLMLLAVSPLAFAECVEFDFESKYQETQVIFTGTVESSLDTCSMLPGIDPGARCTGGGLTFARISIEEIYKDSFQSLERKRQMQGKAVLINGGTIEDVRLEPGDKYLVFGGYVATDMIATGPCSGTKSVQALDAGYDITRLKRLREAFDELP